MLKHFQPVSFYMPVRLAAPMFSALLAFSLGGAAGAADLTPAEFEASFDKPVAAQAPVAEKPLLRHFVALKFKDDSTAEQTGKVVDAFRELKTLVPFVHAMENGTNISPEGYSKGFTHTFLLSFKTEKDRDAYLAHPEHGKFKATALPYVDEILVLDFWGRP